MIGYSILLASGRTPLKEPEFCQVVKDNFGSYESKKIDSFVDPIIGSQFKKATVVAMRERKQRK